MKVFLIDDNPVALKMLSYTVSKAGYQVAVAQSGVEALEKIPLERPDVIVMDVMMPQMDGFEVVRQLRTNPDTEYIPVLLLTAKGMVQDKVTGFEAGADDYVVKPVTPAELTARIKALIRRSAMRAEAPSTSRARIITFLGTKGGVGTTTLAVNVAMALGQGGKNVILADLHPWAGAVAAQMGLIPHSSLAALAKEKPTEITRRLLEGCLERHPSGIQVLAAAHRRAEHRGELDTEQIAAVLEQLERMGEVIVVDAGNGLTSTAIQAMRRSHLTILVIEPDSVTLALANDMIRRLEGMDLGGSKLRLVMIGRSRSASTFTREEVEEQLDSKLLAVLTPAPEICFHATQTGIPIVLGRPNTATAKQFRTISEAIL
jgi:CheY-like chemotaxis protein